MGEEPENPDFSQITEKLTEDDDSLDTFFKKKDKKGKKKKKKKAEKGIVFPVFVYKKQLLWWAVYSIDIFTR